MKEPKAQRVMTLGVVAVAAAALGMVLAGGLGLTPEGSASRPAPIAEAPVAAAGLPDFAALAERVVPSVISVTTTDIVTGRELQQFHRNMDPFEFFFGPQPFGPDSGRPRKRQGAGSGFFIRSDGLALTNNHVVEGADTINVQLADNTQRKAKIVGLDAATDLALIKVEGGPFTPLPLGDSDALRVGEWVMAVGNPLAMDHTVTVGVVSAKGRALGLLERSFENYIQTDAAINLGNSGGPLVNLRGEAVGINSAINAAGQNLGFAIPINTAKLILPQLEKTGKVVRGYLGVFVKDVEEKEQEAFKLPSREGALVQDLEKDGPAEQAGVKAGDVIVAVNGTPVKVTRDLIDRVSSLPPGEKVKLEVIRNGKRQTLTATLKERPASGEQAQGRGGSSGTPVGKLGLQVDELDRRTRRQLDIPDTVTGVVISDVEDLSAADEAGLRPGLVIVSVNGTEVASPSDLTEALRDVGSGAMVRLYVYDPRVGRSSFYILRMP